MKPSASKLAIFHFVLLPSVALGVKDCEFIELRIRSASIHVIARDRQLVKAALDIKDSGDVVNSKTFLNSIGYHWRSGGTTWVYWGGPQYERKWRIRENFEEIVEKYIAREARAFAKVELAKNHKFSLDMEFGLSSDGYVPKREWKTQFGENAYARYDLSGAEVRQLFSALKSEESPSLLFPRRPCTAQAYLTSTLDGSSRTRILTVLWRHPEHFNDAKPNVIHQLFSSLGANSKRMNTVKGRFVYDITYYIPGLYRDALAPRAKRQK